MTGSNHTDSALLEMLVDKYKLAQPVPAEIQEIILSSKKKIFLRILKTVGSFTVLYGLFLSLYFALKKAGIWFTVSKCIISGITVASISYGGYYAVTTYSTGHQKKIAESLRRELIADHAIGNTVTWVDQIVLYNGKIINGAVLSRGETYEIMTAGGRITIPRNQIKIVRPAGPAAKK